MPDKLPSSAEKAARNRAMAALGSKAQEKIAVYRATGDLKTRDEAFSLLWQMLLHDGEIKAHIKFNELKLPRWKRPDSKQVAEEATASLLAQSLTALTNKFDPNRAGLRTYLSWKILSKIGDHGRKEKWWDTPPQPLDGNAAATLGDDAVIGAPAGRTEPERGWEISTFWSDADALLNAGEFAVLLCVVEGHTDAEGAALLEIPLSTYKGRKRSMLKKLRTHYPDLDLGMLYGEAPPPNDD